MRIFDQKILEVAITDSKVYILFELSYPSSCNRCLKFQKFIISTPDLGPL